MCDLLTFAVQHNCQLPEAAGITPRTKTFVIEKHQNQGGGHEYGPGYDVYTITSGSCSCGMFITTPTTEETDALEVRLRKKYAKKGWNQIKIDRAIEDQQRHRPSGFQGVRPDVAHYLALVASAGGEIRFLVHSHRGPFISEQFATLGPTFIVVGDLTSNKMSLDRDHIYIVRVAYPQARKSVVP